MGRDKRRRARRRGEIEVVSTSEDGQGGDREGRVIVMERNDRKDDKREYRLERIDSKADRARAVADKRHSLVALIKWGLVVLGVFYFFGKSVASKGLGLMQSVKDKVGGWFSR